MRRPDPLESRSCRVLDAHRPRADAACALATIAAGLVLTHSIAVRYLLHSSTDWQDEMAVFLLVGATFLSAPYVQSMRGHIAIEAIRDFCRNRSSGFANSSPTSSACVLRVLCLAVAGCCCWKRSKTAA